MEADISKMVGILEKYKSDAEHMVYEIEDDGYMHSTEWFYYSGMIKAFTMAISTLTNFKKEN